MKKWQKLSFDYHQIRNLSDQSLQYRIDLSSPGIDIDIEDLFSVEYT